MKSLTVKKCVLKNDKFYQNIKVWKSSSLPIWTSDGVDEGVSISSCSGSAIWWSEEGASWLQHEEAVLEVENMDVEKGNLCRLAGVLGGDGTRQASVVGGTGKTMGIVESESLLMSMTWMGEEGLRRFTWYFLGPLWPCRGATCL